MTLSIDDLVFPVLVLAGTAIGLSRSPASLGSCSPLALKRGHFDDLKIIDMSGRNFTVKAARKIGVKKRWWSPPLFLTLVNVRLDLQASGNTTLQDLKSCFLRMFKADPHTWKSMAPSYEQFAADIGECESFGELANYVRQF